MRSIVRGSAVPIALVMSGAMASISVAACSAAAQDAPNREAAALIRKEYLADLDSLHSRFLALANAFPAEKYSWRPGPNVRSVGEVLMHAASEYYTFAVGAYGATPSPLITRTAAGFKEFESKASKSEAARHLREGFAFAKQTIDALDPAALAGSITIWGGKHTIAETSFAVTDDLHEHLGQLIAYARMNGIVPPWSK
jgi:uncharacterized damage-inducible protein DinB